MIEGITILNTTLVEGGFSIWEFIIAGIAVLCFSFVLGLGVWDGGGNPRTPYCSSFSTAYIHIAMGCK